MAAASRASEVERTRWEREMQVAHVELRTAEAPELNDLLEAEYAEIDGLIEAKLSVDDFVDLDFLKRQAEDAPFPRSDLETPEPAPLPIRVPRPPVFAEPAPPTGLFGKKRSSTRGNGRSTTTSSYECSEKRIARPSRLETRTPPGNMPTASRLV